MTMHAITMPDPTPALCPIVDRSGEPIRKARLSSAKNQARRRKTDGWCNELGDALIAISFGLDEGPRLGRMPNDARGISKEARDSNVYGALADHLDPLTDHTPWHLRCSFPSDPRKRRPKKWHPRRPA